MSARIRLDLRGSLPTPLEVAPAADHLRGGGILAYPTETVYGFGGLCTPEAVERVRALKRRSEDRPLLVLVCSAEQASGLGWTTSARELASIFWPGALTLVLTDPDRVFPDGVRSAEGTVAVRVSPHPVVAALLELLPTPVTSTSANVPGGAPARSADQALRAATELGAGEELLVLDGGTLPPSGPSTIVDCTGPVPWVVREGTLPLSRLRCAVPALHGR
ncbi:MAG: threonylcarbamoyl-AMP synthase [Gemmatimonadetes bacterium]|nr:threonylcarbamoyl-AMP synthase [Gemmatimonadota bacterium]